MKQQYRVATGNHRTMMDAIAEIRGHIRSSLDGSAADELLARIPVPELSAALSAILQAEDGDAIGDACLVIRDCALLASSPGHDQFCAELLESGVIKHLEAHLFSDDHFTRARIVYTLGKIGSTESLPALHKAFTTYREGYGPAPRARPNRREHVARRGRMGTHRQRTGESRLPHALERY